MHRRPPIVVYEDGHRRSHLWRGGTMSEQRASERITEEVTSWSGVAAGPGRRGEFAFKVGSREIGHLHGDQAAHFTFPKPVWKRLFEEGRIDYHPIFPGREGLGARRIEHDDDVQDVIAPLRLNCEGGFERQGRPVRARRAPGGGQLPPLPIPVAAPVTIATLSSCR